MANNPKKYASLITLQNLVNNIKSIFVKKTDLETTLLGYDTKGSAATVQTNLNAVNDTLNSHTKNSDIHFTSTERTKLSGIAAGAQVNTVTGVKGGSESTYRTGNINITKANIGLGNVDNTADANKTVKHAATADSATSATKATQDASGNVITSTYETKTNVASKLTEAKTYADSAATTAANKVKNDLLNGAGGAYDTLKELGDLIDDNQDAIEALEVVASSKADKTHTHAIADVSGLQSALDGKASSSHGTHVSYSTTAPVMDGTASAGSASTVARSDHKHPTDTSRASKAEFDSHDSNTTKHITATERTNWNAAKSHADSAHAPSNAEKNQNAFSNIKVGSTTIAADSITDTLELVGSNVTITPDATNDKVTIGVATGSTSTAGIVKLTNSTSSTSTTTAATPNSVKLAYDLANSKVDSLSDLGITATATEINYVDGAISNIQKQLDEKHTHWIEQGSKVILSSRSVSNNATLGDLTSVTPPDYIVVTFDNAVYRCAMWTNSFGEKCYGDSRIAEATDMTNPENTPFYINACADDGANFSLVWDWYILFNSNVSSASHTIKINEAKYHTLNERFIPDTIARASDVSQVQIITWEVND